MNRTKEVLRSLLKDECGADLIEYALVASVLALCAVAAESSLVNKIGNEFNTITNHF
jgi:Flp pilus assembly pilin Flp